MRKKRVWALLASAYLVLLHLLLVLFISKPYWIERVREALGFPMPELTEYYRTLVDLQLRADAHVAPGAVLFFGASQVQGLCVTCIDARAVNYGIGGDTTAGVLERLSKYRSLETATAVFISVGFNDLRRRSIEAALANYEQVLQRIPATTPVIASAVFPVDDRIDDVKEVSNEAIRRLNDGVRSLCSARRGCRFLDPREQLIDTAGRLRADMHDGDGLHLNASGYKIWMAQIAGAIAEIRSAR